HERLQALGGEAFRAELVARDPAMARLAPGDTTRLTRAWEVLEATGRPLSAWQAESAEGPPPGLTFHIVVLAPPRDALYARCDRRFALMLEQGALEEVRRLDALGLDPALPVMKALGVPELRAFLHGAMTLDEATAKARQSTRNYAKRQGTWFRHQLAARPPAAAHGCHAVTALYGENVRDAILRTLDKNVRL
ncbi:MAG TPA: tRNA dimethylallyltransferase, partial [Azospirillum sp.]